MPVPKTPTVAKTKTQTNGSKKKPQRGVVYPRYEVRICCLPKEDAVTGELVEYDGPITVAMAKELLGWETDDEYVKRMLTEDPNRKEKKLRETDHLLKDKAGNKVRCFNNTLNRPFDLGWCKKISQDILTEDWSMNLEDIIVGRTGLVLSGQHRLVALILAYEVWEMNNKSYKEHWVDVEPYIEAVVAFGAAEDQKTLQTFDNVKPRALSDTIYTSPVFAGLNSSAKKRCSVMMDQAVDFLWRRLDATSNKFVEYQTHSASLDFLERHQKHLVAAVKHIFDLDGSEDGLALSATLGLNAGRTAAMLFLMGSSNTDEEGAEKYHALNSPKKESQLDWTHWDRALAFWEDVCKGRKKGTKVVEGKTVDNYVMPEWTEEFRKGLGDLCNKHWAGTVSDNEKAAVASIAWAEYLGGNEFFKCEEIVPEIKIDTERNKRIMVDPPVFGFHDKGQVQKKEDPPVDPAQVAAAAAAEKERGLAATLDAAKKGTVKADAGRKVVPNPSPKNTGTLNPTNGKRGKGAEDFVPSASDLDEAAIEHTADEDAEDYDSFAAGIVDEVAADLAEEPELVAPVVTEKPKRSRKKK